MDLYSIVTGQDPQAEADARALAASLRRQKGQAGIDALSFAKPVREAAAASALDAWKRDERLSELPRQRLTQALERANVDRINEEQAALNDPAYTRASMAFLQSVDPELARQSQGAQGRVLQPIMRLALDKKKAEEANAARIAAMANAGYWRGAQQDATDEKAKQIGDAIIAGKQSPNMRGLFRYGGPVKAYLSSQGYDHATAQNEWNALQKYLASANGPTMVRMQNAVAMIPQQVAKIESLYEKWKQLAPVSGIKAFNRASLGIAKQTGGDIGAVAHALEAQIADLTSELGFIYTGGTAPTDNAFKLAQHNLAADWDEPSFAMAIKNIRDAAMYRRNAMGASQILGTPTNRYDPRQQQGPAPAAAPSPGGRFTHPKYPGKFFDANGNEVP